MFYELDTLDMYGTTPWKRADKAPANGTFEGTVNVLASLTQASVPNVQLAHGNYVKRADIGVSDVHESYNLGKRDILEAPNFLPDGYEFPYFNLSMSAHSEPDTAASSTRRSRCTVSLPSTSSGCLPRAIKRHTASRRSRSLPSRLRHVPLCPTTAAYRIAN